MWKSDDLIRCGGSDLVWQDLLWIQIGGGSYMIERDLVWIQIGGGSGVAACVVFGKGKRGCCVC